MRWSTTLKRVRRDWGRLAVSSFAGASPRKFVRTEAVPVAEFTALVETFADLADPRVRAAPGRADSYGSAACSTRPSPRCQIGYGV
jgi:hypothetical protein